MKTFFIVTVIAVSLFVVLSSILLMLFAKPVKKRVKLSKAKNIAYISVLTAISALANMFSIVIDNNFAISFVAIPCFIAGYAFGCVEGFAVGFIGDLIGCLIMPKGVYSPILSLSSGLWGFIPGVMFKYIKGNDNLKTIICFIICLIICTAFLNTFGLWYVYAMGKKAFWAYLWVRLPWQALVTLINMFVSLALLTFLPLIVPSEKT